MRKPLEAIDRSVAIDRGPQASALGRAPLAHRDDSEAGHISPHGHDTSPHGQLVHPASSIREIAWEIVAASRSLERARGQCYR